MTLLGLGDIEFFRILLGTSFSAADIVCYGAGCLLLWAAEWLSRRNYDNSDDMTKKKEKENGTNL